MKKGRFSEARIIGILKEQEAGNATAEVCAGTVSAKRRFIAERRGLGGWRSPRRSGCGRWRMRKPG